MRYASRAPEQCPTPSFRISEQKLKSDLSYTWIHGRRDQPKGRIDNVALWRAKISVVEDIEELDAELKRLGFGEG